MVSVSQICMYLRANCWQELHLNILKLTLWVVFISALNRTLRAGERLAGGHDWGGGCMQDEGGVKIWEWLKGGIEGGGGEESVRREGKRNKTVTPMSSIYQPSIPWHTHISFLSYTYQWRSMLVCKHLFDCGQVNRCAPGEISLMSSLACGDYYIFGHHVHGPINRHALPIGATLFLWPNTQGNI